MSEIDKFYKLHYNNEFLNVFLNNLGKDFIIKNIDNIEYFFKNYSMYPQKNNYSKLIKNYKSYYSIYSKVIELKIPIGLLIEYELFFNNDFCDFYEKVQTEFDKSSIFKIYKLYIEHKFAYDLNYFLIIIKKIIELFSFMNNHSYITLQTAYYNEESEYCDMTYKNEEEINKTIKKIENDNILNIILIMDMMDDDDNFYKNNKKLIKSYLKELLRT